MELGQIVGALPDLGLPEVLVGAATGDDAAVYRISDSRALVATVDFFTPIVDDAAEFGAIAAANSLSDVYAVGATPLFALSLVAFPRDLLATGALEQMVRGGASVMAAAGVPVVGGHSIDDAEPKLGYAVIGDVHPDRLVTHRGARPGDLLILTKPLGVGLVATAVKEERCPAAVERRAVASMTHLNREASAAMLAAGATAATDVTGFGLIGHLRNFGVGAQINLAAVPVLAGAWDLAAAGLYPGGTRRNFDAYGADVDWGGLDERERLMLCDAQTSGGLLIALPPEAETRFREAMAGSPYAPAVIGQVTADAGIRVQR